MCLVWFVERAWAACVQTSGGEFQTAQGNSLVLHCASLLHMIFASSACAFGRMHVQNVRDFPQTKLDNGVNSPFILNKHGDPRFCFPSIYEEQSNEEHICSRGKKV